VNKPYAVENIQPSKIPALIEKLQDKIGIILFHNHSSGSNHMFDIILQNLASEFPEVPFFKTTTDADNQFFQKLGVRSFPFTVIVKAKTVVDCFEGLISKRQFREKINRFLESS